MPYETIKSELAYKGLIIDVTKDTITLPDGRQAVREVVRHGGAAAVVAVDGDGRLVFVRQYRHPARALVLEIPAGTLEPGEEPLACATRELAEETGMRAEKVTFLFKLYTTIGFCSEVIHIYLAEGLTEGSQCLDADEFVTVERYTPAEAAELIKNGGIVDGKTIAAVMVYLNGNFSA
ncbi:MAG: NUDIX hydrolase [Defluviitaleaceae bacterium]|nr:NUDIX hydrolase [Defluviitaleaceae bacterium]